jgi:eukaryotic-like serine/threonine-protein kinase
MEYLQGITLRDLLGEYGRLTSEQTMDILEAVLAGLVAAHKAGIIHRDLKPENVLLADDGRIKLGDFGLARAATSSTASGQALLGTIAYLSPELVTRGIADTRSDVYAVGIMMYEMLTGEQPFKGEQPVQIAYQHANDSVPAPSLKNASVPALLDDLTLWATARDPEERPRDARAMLDQLFETQHLMRAGDTRPQTDRLPTQATGRTAVLPPSPTTVLPRTGTAPVPRAAATTARSTVVDRLRTATGRAHRRGAWAFAAVLVAGALAAGTGWYFGDGPGSTSAVPGVSGMSEDGATAAIVAQGFRAGNPTTAWSPLDPGVAAGTRPAEGTPLRPGSTVSVVLSRGQQPSTAPAVKGDTVVLATQSVVQADLRVAEVVSRSSERAAGTVIRMLDGDGDVVAEGDELPAGSGVVLVVSSGPPAIPTGSPTPDSTAATTIG